MLMLMMMMMQVWVMDAALVLLSLYKGKDIVFRFIVEYSSLKGFL
jgi:hypothetical protein